MTPNVLRIKLAAIIGRRRSDIGGITALGSKRPIGAATPAPPRRDYGDRRFDPGDPRTFRSDAAINLELGRLSRDEQRRYRDMTDRERRQYDDRLAEDAQRRYERMTDPEQQRYIDDLQSEQRRLDSARRR
jgi:hypothetical protein